MSHRRRLNRRFTGVADPIQRRARVGAIAVALLAGGSSLLAPSVAQAGPLQGTSALGAYEGASPNVTIHDAASAVGDFNGDGFDDLAFGEGTALRIVAGDAGGVNRADIADGTTSGVYRLELPSWFSDVDAAGDFDGDGVDDLIVTAYKMVYVFYGARGPLQGSGTLIDSGRVTPITTEYASGLGSDASAHGHGIGDFNGDGKGDVVVVRTDRHVAIVYGGARVATIDAKKKSDRTSLINSPIECGWFFYIPVCVPRADPLVSAAGDFNGDGRADLAVDSAEMSEKGKRWILFGRTGTFTTESKAPSNAMQIPRPSAVLNQVQGSMPVRVGDLNGDGRDELHARDFAPAGSWAITRYVLGTANPPASLDVATAPSIDLIDGFSARAVGDGDGDGRRDIAFLAPSTWTVSETRKSGELRIVTAPTGAATLRATDGKIVKGLPVAEMLGSGLADADGDGLTDIVLATTDALRNPGSTSRKRLFFVATRGVDTIPPQLGPVSIGTPRFIGAVGADLSVSADETDTAVEIVYNRQVGAGFVTEATERRAVQRGINTLRIKDAVGGLTLPVGDYRADVRPIDPAGNRGSVRSVNFTLYVDGPGTPTALPASLADFKLSGDAAGSGDSVALVTGNAGTVGTAVFPVKRDFNGRTFEFDVDIVGAPPEGGAMGVAMGFISAEPDGNGNWLGRGGEQLGIGGLGGFSLAWDVSKGPNDPSDNFIGWSPGTLGQGMQWVHTNASGIPRIANLPLMQGSFKVTLLNKRLRVYVDGVLRMDRAALVPPKSRLAFTAASAPFDGGIVELKNLKVS